MSVSRRKFFSYGVATLGGLTMVCSASLLAAVMHQRDMATPSASPKTLFESVVPSDEGISYPVVDWDSWADTNPDVVAWMSIPGTDVSLPVAQGFESDPTYYLSHDVNGDWNVYGCPYLDWESARACDPHNSVVMGHHTDDGIMFAPLENYSNHGWAASHPNILWQTPATKQALQVAFVQVVDADVSRKRFEFADSRDYLNWVEEQRVNAVVDLGVTPTTCLYTFCTCSYTTYASERTLVFAFGKE